MPQITIINVLLLVIPVIVINIQYTIAANVLTPNPVIESTLPSPQSSRSVPTNNGQPIQSQHSLLSRPVYDTLLSIDQRIRLLEAYDNTYKLTRLDFTLDQMSQRIVSIESKLLRLENSLDSKMTKIEEMLVSSERKVEFKTESLSRKIDDLSDRIELKWAHIEIKFESVINKIVDKLDSIETLIDRNNEQVMAKLVKYDERHTVFESHVKSHIINIESLVKHSLDANTKIKDIVTKNFESIDKINNIFQDYKQYHNSVLTRLSTVTNQLQNITSINAKNNNNCNTNAINNQSNGRALEDDLNSTTTDDNPKNQLPSLDQLRQLAVDERLTQLDVHVDYYSRKIINTIQEIWRSSQTSEEYLRDAIDAANKSRSFIRQEFHRLQELIGPLTKTPDFSDIREPLEQKLYHLSTTIDDSFNALLISQNSFISSCNRIQEEEEQLYDVLDDMLIEMRNKSSVDVSDIKQSIESVKQLLNTSVSTLQTQMDSFIADIKQLNLFNPNQQLLTGEECFLTKSQLVSVCHSGHKQVDQHLPSN